VFDLAENEVSDALNEVLQMMAGAGYSVEEEVDVVVDKNLPFMGYTSRQGRKHTIVVSGMAVGSAMLKGLLAHELSHVYRNVTNHPSHDEKILTVVAGSFIRNHRVDMDYQKQILHQVINHVQDLYADDITMKILTSESGLFDPEQLEAFFVEWVKEEPVKTEMEKRDRWINAGIMLNNSFAISNMQRHDIKEGDHRAEFKNARFLNQINPQAATEFAYFNDFMIGLKEHVTESEFKQEMKEYLERFYEVVEKI
jgi:hypothetical protein